MRLNLRGEPAFNVPLLFAMCDGPHWLDLVAVVCGPVNLVRSHVAIVTVDREEKQTVEIACR